MVAVRIARGIKKCQGTGAGNPQELRDRGGTIVELGPVETGKFLESRGVMPEPFPQGRAGCHVATPVVERRIPLAHAAWPKAIDQHPGPVIRRYGLVHSLGADIHGQIRAQIGRSPGASGHDAVAGLVRGARQLHAALLDE